MESPDVFANFRPIYILFILILVISLFTTIFQKTHYKIVNGFTVAILILISIVVSAFLTYQVGVLSDELGIGGDAVSMIMFIVIVILSLVHLFAYASKNGVRK